MNIVVELFTDYDGKYSYARWRVRDTDAIGRHLQFLADFSIETDAYAYRDELKRRLMNKGVTK